MTIPDLIKATEIEGLYLDSKAEVIRLMEEVERLRAEVSQLQGQVAWLRSAIDTVVGPKP